MSLLYPYPNIKNFMNNMKILSLEEYIKLNEGFHNPFDVDIDNNSSNRNITNLSDFGGVFKPRKESFNISRIEWRRKPGGGYKVYSKTPFRKGEIIEICPLIIIPEISKTIDRLNDIIFEINKERGEYAVVLGYASLYRHSDTPNVDYAYNRKRNYMLFIANRNIKAFEELTINYGSDYWEERNSRKGYNMEESEIQPNASDIEAGKVAKEFGEPNSRINPAISGISIKGVGQS